MWSWDTKEEMSISVLHNNLVVQFRDYMTSEPFYSFLGNNEVTDTARKLIELSTKDGFGPVLKLMPEDSIKGVDKSIFTITEDRDHYDYIFSITDLFQYQGSLFAEHRNKVRRFEKKHKFEILNLNLENPINQKLLLTLVESWVNKRKKATNSEDCLKPKDMENELLAFKKLLYAPVILLKSLICFALFIDGNLSGFIINEKISNDYCLAHFGKADTKHDGIYHFLMQQNAKIFLDLGVTYLNHEQDLGLPNLRFSKSGYNPVHFLKKYTVALQNNLV